MKTRKLKGILITPNKYGTEPRVMEIDYSGFKDLYKLLDCDIVEIPQYKFGNAILDVYCDEEGLFKNFNMPSIVTYNSMFGNSMVVGSVFIVGRNNRSLTDKQIQEVMGTVQELKLPNGRTLKVAVSKC